MGNNRESSDSNVLQKGMTSPSNMCSAKVKTRDHCKSHPDYTNRRKIKISADSLKSSEEQRKENEEEFEYIRFQLEEFLISDQPSTKHSRMSKSNSGSAISTSSSNRHPEVDEFQRFLDEQGGHYGGWKEKDHLFFLKTIRKYPLNKTAEIVHENFPDISIEKVIAHDTWYSEYLKLKVAKKRAIEEWRKTHIQKKISPKVEEEQKCEPQAEPKPLVKRDPNLKQKIEIWKARCVAAKLEKEEEQKQEEMRKKKEEEERKRITEEKRAMINRYREEKLSLELAMRTAKETEKLEAKREAAQQSALLLKYFRYEDRKFTERQKAKKQPPVKQEPRVRSAVEVKRDPNRLLQPTLGWIYHTKRSSEEGHLVSIPMDLKQMPKLKKPAWRKDLSP